MSERSGPSEDLRPYFDAIWEEWLKGHDLEAEIAEHRRNRARFHRLIEECLARLNREPADVLEIGSGTAIDSYILAEQTSARIVGVDISLPSVRVAARCSQYFARPIALVAGDATALPFSDAGFDIVFSQGVVEHFPDPEAMLLEQLRVLRLDGVLVINVPQRRTGYTRFKHRQMAAGTWPWGWETEYSPGELRRLGRRYGLRPIAVVGYDHWGARRGTLYWRHAHTRMQQRNPWRDRRPFRALEAGYERSWNFLEEKLGHYFLINVTMAFVRER
jgi:ubiquinone/menaquinone biosynthesis C-methylase UbiE